MKHLTLSLLCAGLVALTACKKEKPIQPAQSSVESGTSVPGSVKKQKNPPKMFHAQYNPKTGNCWWWYGNCVVIETIVVTAFERQLIDEAAASGSPTKVAGTFLRESLSDLVLYGLTKDGYAEKLQSGKYYIAKTSDDGHIACYIAGAKFPVTAENMEFAFQFSYGEIE